MLLRAKELPEKCPGWYDVAKGVALGQDWSRERFFELFREAFGFEPSYGTFQGQACLWLLPRWHGETGDYEAFLVEQAGQAAPEDRDLRYAQLLWLADRNLPDEELVFGPGRLDYERAQRGYDQWLAKVPDNLLIRMQALRVALLANDRATARKHLDVIGGRFFPAGWAGKVELFEMARKFAYEGGPNPYDEYRKKRSAER